MITDRWRDAVHNNVLYDLWSRDMRSGTDLGDRGHWQRVLQQMTGWPQAKVLAFLSTGSADDEDVRRLADALAIDEETLRYRLMADDEDVLGENVRYLLSTLKHGEKGALANAIGVDRSTISKWLKGAHPPDKANQRALNSFFGLPLDTDLQKEPIFVSFRPLTLRQRREQLRIAIEDVSDDTLRALLPALEKLLDIK